MNYSIVSKLLFVVAALALSTAPKAAPTVVYDTFGPSDSFAFGLARVAGDPGDGANFVAADLFAPTSSGFLDTATLALEALASDSVFAPQNFVRVSVLADAGGTPGALLDTATLGVTTLAPGQREARLETFDFGADTFLLSGFNYWLVVSTVEDDPDFMIAWSMNDQAKVGNQSISGALFQAPNEWFPPFEGTLGAARVQVKAVDEPTNIAFVALALMMLVHNVRTRRRYA